MELMDDGAVRNRGRYLAPDNDACSYSQPALWLPLETMMELGTDMQAAVDAVRVKSAVRRLLGSQVDDIEHLARGAGKGDAAAIVGHDVGPSVPSDVISAIFT